MSTGPAPVETVGTPKRIQGGRKSCPPVGTDVTMKGSWLASLHPFTKLSYIVLTAAAIYALPPRLTCLFLPLLLNAAVAASARMLNKECAALWRILLPLGLFMFPIHGFFHPGNKTVLLAGYGLTVYSEGVHFALLTLLRLAAVLMASFHFVFSTQPADLISAISHTAKSPSLAYLIGSPLLLLTSMRERIETIQAAQRARGLQLDGNVIRRIGNLAPLVFPLVIGAVVEIEQRTIALEVRGFKSTCAKTSLRVLDDSAAQRLARWMMLAASSALLFSFFL